MLYSRLLKFKLPLIRGNDVIAVQRQLHSLGYGVGEPDGLFGPRTEAAVTALQSDKGLRPDGMVGPRTWRQLFNPQAAQVLAGTSTSSTVQAGLKALVDGLKDKPIVYRNSIPWTLTTQGIRIDSQSPVGSGGLPKTVTRVWQELQQPLGQWSEEYGVPVELIIATICTESSGKLDIPAREEPGYISDEATPHRVSPGIMQTLISTAREAVGVATIDRSWLQQPANSIQAGTAYIAKQWKKTHFDPPKVACAYNAGGVYHEQTDTNRWNMRQYPVGTSHHADRFVQWFNDAIEVLSNEPNKPATSFVALMQ